MPNNREQSTIDQLKKLKATSRWVQRAFDDNKNAINNKTHYMASAEVDGKHIVYPTVREVDGKLVELSNDEAFEMAMKNNDALVYTNAEDANWASSYGYKKYTNFPEDVVQSALADWESNNNNMPEELDGTPKENTLSSTVDNTEEVTDIRALGSDGKYLYPYKVAEAALRGEQYDEDRLPPTFIARYKADKAAGADWLSDYATDFNARRQHGAIITEAEERLVQERANAKADVYNVVKGASDISKTAQALSQISRGKKQRQGAERPMAPAQPRGEELKQATQEAGARAQRGFGQPSLGAMSSRDLASYANALKAAQSYGGGQASVSGAMANKAYRDILDRNLQAAVQNEQMQNQNFGQYANLAGQRSNELGQIRNFHNKEYAGRLADHKRDLGEGASSERTGRINLANIESTMPTTMANLTRQYYKAGEQRGNVPLSGTPERDIYDANRQANRIASTQRTKDYLSKMNPHIGQMVKNAFNRPKYGQVNDGSIPLTEVSARNNAANQVMQQTNIPNYMSNYQLYDQLKPIKYYDSPSDYNVPPQSMVTNQNQYLNLSTTPYYGGF